ncbi:MULTISPECIES: hypothetical protein [Bradyrhizobium]|nr:MULTISPECIES: hypothetical protein [Bradyrhizobium]
MLQNLLASIGVVAIVVVTFARMARQARRPLLRQPARSGNLPSRRRRPF